MIKMTLSEPEREQLEAAFKTTPDRRLRARCQAILMAARGRPHRQIAQDVGLSGRTIQRWLKAYQQRGLDGLKMRWASGRTAKIPETLAPAILDGVKHGPASCGLARAHWTYAELATYLYHTPGLTVSESTMRLFGQQHGVRPSRPTYHDLKADPPPQPAAHQDLQT